MDSSGTVSQVITSGSGPEPGPSFEFSLLPRTAAGMAAPGTTALYTLALQNTGTGEESYTLALTGDLTGTVSPSSLTLTRGESAMLTAALAVPSGAVPGSILNNLVTCRSVSRVAAANCSIATTVAGAGPAPSPDPDTPQEVSVELKAGWNPFGLKTRDLLGVVVPPQAIGYANYVTEYELGTLSQATLVAVGVPPRAVWVFCTAPCTLTYSGRPTSSAVVPVQAGWNMVSFPSSAPLVASSVRARKDGASAPIGSVILTTVYEIQPTDLSNKPVVLTQPEALLQPGRVYWVFANSPCELLYP